MEGKCHARTNQSVYSQENRIQRLLRSNMTDAEQKLWRGLRGRQLHGWKFRRQHPYGDYVLDFVCLEAKLVVEVDGGQHVEQRQDDISRDANLRAAGFAVLRFWNHQVMQQSDDVMEAIVAALPATNPPPSQPSP